MIGMGLLASLCFLNSAPIPRTERYVRFVPTNIHGNGDASSHPFRSTPINGHSQSLSAPLKGAKFGSRRARAVQRTGSIGVAGPRQVNPGYALTTFAA